MTMKKRPDLIDQFTELIVGADDPRKLAERTLDVAIALINGRSGAVFAYDADRLALFASRAIDQHVLDFAQAAWNQYKDSFLNGETFYVPDLTSERRLTVLTSRTSCASFAMVPVFDGDRFVALLYVDSLDPHFCESHDLMRLQKFSRIVAKAVGTQQSTPEALHVPADAWQTYLERTPVEDMEREKLLLLLNRNEWNIARVARLMGVTRRTIYLRLQRYKIPRERIFKTRNKGRAAKATAER